MEMFFDKQVPRRFAAHGACVSEFREQSERHRGGGARGWRARATQHRRDQSSGFRALQLAASRRTFDPKPLHSWTWAGPAGCRSWKRPTRFAEALKYYAFRDARSTISTPNWNSGSLVASWRWATLQLRRTHYARARDLDTLRFRADSRINDIIRATAKASGEQAATPRYGCAV